MPFDGYEFNRRPSLPPRRYRRTGWAPLAFVGILYLWGGPSMILTLFYIYPDPIAFFEEITQFKFIPTSAIAIWFVITWALVRLHVWYFFPLERKQ